MIEQHWLELEHEFENIKLDEYVLMPNHLHGIIIFVGAGLVSVQSPSADKDLQNICKDREQVSVKSGQYPVRADTRPAPTIGDIICTFKSRTTNCYIQNVKQNNWSPFNKRLWQRNYFEHIVRNEEELSKIRYYIINNPIKWEIDNDNPNKL